MSVTKPLTVSVSAAGGGGGAGGAGGVAAGDGSEPELQAPRAIAAVSNIVSEYFLPNIIDVPLFIVGVLVIGFYVDRFAPVPNTRTND
jgi:hypothetical protein